MIDVKRECTFKTTIFTKNCIEFFDHAKILRRYLNETKQKIVFKSTFFDLLEILKSLMIKLYVDFKIERVKTRCKSDVNVNELDSIRSKVYRGASYIISYK